MKSYAWSMGNVVSIIDNGNLERRILQYLFISFGALALLYILILGNMVFNIVERKSLESHVRTLSSEVAEMELSYLSMSKGLDLAYSRTLGFKEANITFATRKALGSLQMKQNDL